VPFRCYSRQWYWDVPYGASRLMRL